MTDSKKERPIFSKESLVAKQARQREEMEQQRVELRKVIQQVAQTGSGYHLLRYLFLLCGGDSSQIRRDKEGRFDEAETKIALGVKGVWENIRFNMDSDTIKKIERHNWEEEGK